MRILATQDELLEQRLDNDSSPTFRKVEKQFKKSMTEYIKYICQI